MSFNVKKKEFKSLLLFFFLITLLDQFINFTYTLNNIINILCFYGVIPWISRKTQITQFWCLKNLKIS